MQLLLASIFLLDSGNFDVIGELGSGFSARVSLVQDRSGDNHRTIMALKVINGPNVDPSDEIKFFEACSDEDYAQIVRFHRYFVDVDVETKRHSLLMEFCEGGTLEAVLTEHVRANRRIDEATLLDWAVQLLCG